MSELLAVNPPAVIGPMATELVQAKISEARTQIDQLERALKATAKDPSRKADLYLRLNPDTGLHELFLDDIPELSDLAAKFSVSIGVILHLLRSALDNHVYHLADSASDTILRKPDQIQFPIVDDEKDWNRQKDRRLLEIPDRIASAITSVQPFRGLAGRPDNYSGPYIHQLTLLRNLSNLDKHQLFVTITVDANQFEMNRLASPVIDAHLALVGSDPRGYFKESHKTEMVSGSLVFPALKTNSNITERTHAGHAIPSFRLPEGRPIIPTLNRIENFVISECISIS